MLIRKVSAFAFCFFAAVALHAQGRATVAGYIHDAASGEPVIGATVMSGGTGTFSGNDGRYSLSVPRDTCEIVVTSVGYAPCRIRRAVKDDISLDISLVPGETLDRAVVTADRDRGFVPTGPGTATLPLWIMDDVPSVLGEPDLVKSVQLLPGVQDGMEGLSGIYVRGGGPDENYFLLDGVPMYGISHALGLFSAFTPDAVKKVTVYKGDFPVDYGGRVSGIVDIRTNDGNTQELRGKARIGLINDALHFEGPLFSDRTTFSASARTAHTLLLQPVISLAGAGLQYFFYDANLKVVHRFRGGDKMFLSLYDGDDNFQHSSKERTYKVKGDRITTHDEEKIRWGNTVVSARWKHVFGPALYSDMMLAYNGYSMETGSESFSRNRAGVETSTMRGLGSGIADIRAGAVFRYSRHGHRIVFGAEAIHHDFRPRTSSEIKTSADTVFRAAEKTWSGLESAFFAGDEFSICKRLSVSAGMRHSLMQTEGRWYSIHEPRVSLKFTPAEKTDFHVSYSGASQYVHLLSYSDVSMPTDIWVPVTGKLKPVISEQLSAGGRYFGQDRYAFSIEAYWKKTANVLEYKDGVSPLSGAGGWESLVAMGEGLAYGVEFSADLSFERLDLSLAYTWSRAWRRFPDGEINMGEWFPYRYDRPHDLTVVAAWRLGPDLSLNASWVLRSGPVMTLAERPTYLYSPVMAQEYEFVAGRNNFRLPPTHRLNAGLNWTRKYRRGKGEWDFSVYNLYNAMNPNLVYSEERIAYRDGAYRYKRSYRKVTYLPILPSVSYTYSF